MDKLIDLRTCKTGIEGMLSLEKRTKVQQKVDAPMLTVSMPFLEQIRERGNKQAPHKMNSRNSE